jgi:hypothetical protein
MMADPRIVRSGPDKTGGGGRIVEACFRSIGQRFAEILKAAEAILKTATHFSIPVANEASSKYLVESKTIYQLTPVQMQEMLAKVDASVDKWLMEGSGGPGMWYGQSLTDAAMLGASLEAANLSAQSEVYAATRSLTQIVGSQAWQNRVAAAKLQSHAHWTGISSTLKAALSDVISDAVANGLSPKAAKKGIMAALSSSESDARRHAQTDILGALRKARLDETEHLRMSMGIQTGLLWNSALMPGTRPWHASRHGRVYTRAEVMAFYSERRNRYHCYCAQVAVLLGDDGRPMLSSKMKESMAEERAAFDESSDAHL